MTDVNENINTVTGEVHTDDGKEVHSHYHWKATSMLPSFEGATQQRVMHQHGGLEFVGYIDNADNHTLALDMITDIVKNTLMSEFALSEEAVDNTNIIVDTLNLTGAMLVQVQPVAE